jgi:Uma2 family endonuclease
MLKPAIPTQFMTAEEFLIWAETQPREAGKFELWDGEVIMTRSPSDSPLDMQSERSQHWDVKGMVFAAFRDAIKRAGLPCHAVVDGASVSLPALNHSLAKRDKLVVPDVLVYCGPKVPRNVLIVPNPVIVVEVLSPGTSNFVVTGKLEGYFKHPTIQHYLVVNADEPLVVHHQRGQDDAWTTRIVSNNQLRLDPPGLDVDLSELFEVEPEA